MKNKLKIFIADDHQIVIDGIKSMLIDNKLFEIIGEASNGQEAMDKISIAPEKYDLLISDISMPLLSGTDLCKMVKSKFPDKKVLILSMYSSSPMVKEVISAEADGYLLKNAGKECLLEALHRISNNGTYYSNEIIPVIINQLEKEKKLIEDVSILSEREKEILKLIVAEKTSEEIASKLFISKKTVDNHRANILEKTQSKSTIGLVKFALRNNLS
jgi:two-component system, NarL family, nitrate/nitrite response regulator NarL